MYIFCGINFKGLTLDDIFEKQDSLSHVVTVNAEYIVRANEEDRFATILSKGIATFDGQVPYLVARLKNIVKSAPCKIDKISGSELIYSICEHAKLDKKKVFLLGGEEESNQRSVSALLSKFSGLNVEGYSPAFEPYPFSIKNKEEIDARLKQSSPDYLLVGFGVGKQDYWIDDNRQKLDEIGVSMVVGVGGTFEMVSGKYKRAPKILQKLCLEGVYRLFNEPKLFRFKRLLTSFRFFRYI